MENMQSPGKKCDHHHHKVTPIAILLIGLTFLLGDWGMLTAGTVGIIWPVLLIIIGGTKLMGCKYCSHSS